MVLEEEKKLKYKILVVDDELIEREGICFLLNTFYYPLEVVTKNNGRAAVEYIKGNPVDIICSDIKMPFMDGLEFCRIARSMYPTVKIILLTAYNDFEFAKKAIKAKVDDYILKPVVVDEFTDIISQIINDLDEQKKEEENINLCISQFKKFQNISALKEILPYVNSDEYNESLASDNFAVKKVLSIIESEYASNITLGELAGSVYFSRGYLTSIFKKEVGLSISQYTTMLRMEKAQKLLLQTNYKINDIAQAVGYNDTSYFGVIFKRTFGMTPAKIRNGGQEG